MSLPELLAHFLPTRWARAVALSTVPFAVAAASLPHLFSPLWPTSTNAEVVLVQAVVFLLVLLVGALATLALVLVHAQGPRAPAEPDLYKRLPEHHRVILAISRITRPTVAKIARETSLAEETVRYYIGFMRKHKYIESNEPLALTEEGHRAVVQL